MPRTNDYTWRISRLIGHRNEFVSMRTCTSCEAAPIQNDMLPFGHKFDLIDILQTLHMHNAVALGVPFCYETKIDQ